ncbi:MarC family protein [Microbulbifer agarilyticus]|uniref:MarC family protein n=1 Tax=Microbulbifer agarilyticus TaxID=260552 RepID=UPI001C947B8E|nr:MarC family protein [Microbulbifer agarilyticus]MBY6191722.1 MarC family protein [Microbulbifer agarilyticus]MBY6212974.1 MarC family protein [Microbulbifer agarilyticus]MCA0894546.1 MarC family protein [Microbulbifer agarilyticus]
MDDWLSSFVFFFAVIDPVGTLPVFIAVTSRHSEWQRRKIALLAVAVATGILLFFLLAGQYLLEAIGVPLSAFQVSGGIVLFLFALTMIFGESKPEQEVDIIRGGHETAIFPLAVPSIASPGAMLAAVVLTDNHRFDPIHQVNTATAMLAVLGIVLLLLLTANWIYRWIGDAGASIVSRIMGLILASVATTNVLLGIQQFFLS